MDGVIAIAFLMCGALSALLIALYEEKSDWFGVVLSSVTAVVCFVQFFSRIQT